MAVKLLGGVGWIPIPSTARACQDPGSAVSQAPHFSFGCALWLAGTQFPDQGVNPGPSSESPQSQPWDRQGIPRHRAFSPLYPGWKTQAQRSGYLAALQPAGCHGAQSSPSEGRGGGGLFQLLPWEYKGGGRGSKRGSWALGAEASKCTAHFFPNSAQS